MKPLCIHCQPDDLEQGLFGQTFYYLLQLLPYLHEHKLFPQWELRTKHYSDPPDFLGIPGILDLAYTPQAGPYHRISLFEFRRRHAHVLGNDWAALHKLWSAYFRVPDRVYRMTDGVLPEGKVLGIHFRGTDKQTTSWDSNPISKDQYLFLIQEFLESRKEFSAIFVATDEPSFLDMLRSAVSLPVKSLGGAEFHLSEKPLTTRAEKADRALRDCLLLSLCSCVLETSSALPSFAKLLNPELEIYRCAASKLFGKLFTKMPYFPVAHIPVLPTSSERGRKILSETMALDWSEHKDGQPYLRDFVALPRWRVNHHVFQHAERFGVDTALTHVFRGFF